MSFQDDEQEFDFNYIFEYSQDAKSEPVTGGYSTAKEVIFLVLYDLFTAKCKHTVVYWDWWGNLVSMFLLKKAITGSDNSLLQKIF